MPLAMSETAVILALVVLFLPLALSLRAIYRVQGIEERLRRLERGAPSIQPQVAASTPPLPIPLSPAQPGSPFGSGPVVPAATSPEFPSAALESLIGRKALGWVAVLLLFLAAAFFLKYAYDNNWIGPMGQVSLILLGGLLLAGVGRWYAGRGWRLFSMMLTAAGATVLYLATYSAFAYFEILPQQAAGVFLVIVLIELAILALAYQSSLLATVAVLGGLATPVLMTSEYDQYPQFFLYLTVLNLGVALLLIFRNWPVVGTLALVGTQGLFWTWYVVNYHPEKFAAALLFQMALLVIFRAEVWLGDIVRRRPAAVETLVRMVLAAALSFGALYVLLQADYDPWLGSLAVAMAFTYATEARLLLARNPQAQWQILTMLAITAGFIAVALPIQAEAPWVALGWAAEGAVLWWFGLRTRALPLRGLAAAFGGLAIARLLLVDTPTVREPFVPIFNRYGLPALGVTALVLGSFWLSQRWRDRMLPAERRIAHAVGIVGLLVLGWVLSVEVYGYCHAWARIYADQRQSWEWLGLMALSVLWAVYASALLAIGFWRQLPELRWLAFGLYGLTIIKVLAFDMSNLQEFYRILAFFVLAVLLGLAAWAYHRRQLGPEHTFHWGHPR
jgi:uncharacterized membrane protein